MIDWLCACQAGTNGHPWADQQCARCGYLAPPQPVTPVPVFAVPPVVT